MSKNTWLRECSRSTCLPYGKLEAGVGADLRFAYSQRRHLKYR
jgi:hypothetical protein